MALFGVRCIFLWAPISDQRSAHLYEERITLWSATSLDEAIELAEAEALSYARASDEYLGLAQAYQTFEEWELPRQGLEVFSLLRESELEPDAYLAAFFATSDEREGTYGDSR